MSTTITKPPDFNAVRVGSIAGFLATRENAVSIDGPPDHIDYLGHRVERLWIFGGSEVSTQEQAGRKADEIYKRHCHGSVTVTE